jgi:hypothetical protein
VVEGAAMPGPAKPLSSPTVMATRGAAPSVTSATPPRHLPITDGEVMENAIQTIQTIQTVQTVQTVFS